MKEDILIDILNNIKRGSTCYKYKVGAIIVKEGRIISTGWNGTPSKTLECSEFQNIVELVKIVKLSNFLGYKQFLSEVINSIKNYKEFYLEKDFHRKDDVNNLLKNIYYLVNVKYKDYTHIKNKIIKELTLSMEESYFPQNHIHSQYEIHAEMNAISTAAKSGISINNSILYCNYKPCMECAKIIIQSGIKEVKYIMDYIDKRYNKTSDKLFKISGVKLTKIIQE